LTITFQGAILSPCAPPACNAAISPAGWTSCAPPDANSASAATQKPECAKSPPPPTSPLPISTTISAGKDEILFFCQDNALDRLIANLDQTRRSRTTAKEKLRTVINFHLHCVLDEIEGSAAHLLTNSISAHLQKRLLAKRDRYEQGVRQLIAAGIRSNEFADTDPALAARLILGALNSTILWFNPQGPLTTEELAERFAAYLIRGLCHGETSSRRTRSGRSLDRSAASTNKKVANTGAPKW